MTELRLAREKKELEERGYHVQNVGEAHWNIILTGPEASPFEGKKFRIELLFQSFPYVGPKIKMLTSIYHPNVNTEGNICPAMIGTDETWSPVTKMSSVMDRINNLMLAPNPSAPMNNEAAEDYKKGTWFAKAQSYGK